MTYILAMEFTWNEEKNATNLAKHGLCFEEVVPLFTSGADYLELFDEAHSDDEERFIAIGPISHSVILVVWTEQEEGTVRIISARRATKRERTAFERYMENQR